MRKNKVYNEFKRYLKNNRLNILKIKAYSLKNFNKIFKNKFNKKREIDFIK